MVTVPSKQSLNIGKALLAVDSLVVEEVECGAEQTGAHLALYYNVALMDQDPAHLLCSVDEQVGQIDYPIRRGLDGLTELGKIGVLGEFQDLNTLRPMLTLDSLSLFLSSTSTTTTRGLWR